MEAAHKQRQKQARIKQSAFPNIHPDKYFSIPLSDMWLAPSKNEADRLARRKQLRSRMESLHL